ncbi:MAG: DUF4886 domain-containing protein [Bacteroidales bacterium]|nr:DUF4886 domain-containing protein [Bacteroidales bacterium]
MIKRFLLIAAGLTVAFAVSAQVAFQNYPLPQNPDTLRILAVGNSFSDDGTEYLPALLEGAGIHNVVVARLYIGGCSLERHCKEYEEGTKDYVYYKSTDNRWTTVSKNAGILDGLKDEPWDIITVQEVSNHSGTYDTYQAWAPKLISIIRKEALNPRASIVWHMTWAYASNSSHVAFPLYDRNQNKMYNAILDCVRRSRTDFNVPIVIPSGYAVQIARGTRLNNEDRVPAYSTVYQLTRDGFHLSRQYGRYIAACTWFETLIRPVLGKSVKGNPYLLEDTEFTINRKDAKLCQKCAIGAVSSFDKLL